MELTFIVTTATGMELFKVERSLLGDINLSKEEITENARKLYEKHCPNTAIFFEMI